MSMLYQALLGHRNRTHASCSNWKHRWVSLGKQLTGVDLPDPDGEDDRQEWADGCMAKFCTQHEVIGLFNAGVDVLEVGNDHS